MLFDCRQLQKRKFYEGIKHISRIMVAIFANVPVAMRNNEY